MSAGNRAITFLFDPAEPETAEIVRAGLVRSFSAGAVRARPYGSGAHDARGAVAVSPPESAVEELAAFTRGGRKLVLLGPLGPRVAALAGLEATRPADVSAEEARARARLETPFDASPAALAWRTERAPGSDALPVRAFCRFDFEEEWNHLGHGRILSGAGPWSLAMTRGSGDAAELACLKVGEEARGVAASRLDAPEASILWVGRPVGLVDGLDHAVLERFFSDHRHGELPCWPSWCDWPAGFDAAATFRLDCDEAVASARPLFERYRERGVPVSLAVLAGLELGPEDRALVRDVVASGGTVLSHSTRHLPDWGADLDEAREEARGSRATLEAAFPEAEPVRYAVSPFHRNPRHAVRAVAESGYEALVTGIIANDPECLVGRAGILPFSQPPLVSHSQQNMLHGDCYARRKHTIDPWRESFEGHQRAGALYGYLDHPFSGRYAYGWAGEAERIGAHEALLDVVTSSGRPWLPSLGRALDHLVRRARTDLSLDARERPRAQGPDGPEAWTVRFGGRFLGL